MGKIAHQAIKPVTQQDPRKQNLAKSTFRHPRAGGDPLSAWQRNSIGWQERIDSRLRGNDDQDKMMSLPNLYNEVFSENQRAARYLASQKDIGDFSEFVVDGIETDGDKAIAETVDLYRQTADINQDQADALIKKVMPSLNPDNAESLSIGILPDEDGKSLKPAKEPGLKNERFEDSATDDETVSDDNLKFPRDTQDMALRHLIEGGLEPEVAKEFLNRLLSSQTTKSASSVILDVMTWLSGRRWQAEPMKPKL